MVKRLAKIINIIGRNNSDLVLRNNLLFVMRLYFFFDFLFSCSSRNLMRLVNSSTEGN